MKAKVFAVAGLTAVACLAAVALSLTACSDEPSDAFKSACKSQGGVIQKEDGTVLEQTIRTTRRPGSEIVVPKTRSTKSGKSGNHGLFGGTGSTSNSWQCVKDGIVIFEED